MFRKKRIIFVFCLIVIAAVFAGYTRSQYMPAIFMYHSVAPNVDPQNRIEVSVNAFSRQMQFLKTHHYNVIPLEELGEMIRDKKRIPTNTVAITFDDGYKDNYVYAYPILRKLGFPATVFIIINEVGRPQGDRLSWQEIKEMQDSGLITIGSHTFDHPILPEVKSEAELKRQILDSKEFLEQKSGVPVDMFCYPYGRFNAHVRSLVIQAGYRLAFATVLGVGFSNHDLYLIKRVRISSSSNNLFDFWARTSGYYNSFRKHENK